jgi:hypothetical protein
VTASRKAAAGPLNEKLLLGVAEAAAVLDVSENYLRKLIRDRASCQLGRVSREQRAG